MHAKDALRQMVEMSHMIVRTYVEDLTDAQLLVRSVPNTNHIAWQLGHLITSTHHMLAGIAQNPPALPEGFDGAHSKDTASSDDPDRFASKEQYLTLAEQMKTATLAAIDATSDQALDAPGPEAMREYAPTVGAVLMICGNHWLMHAGQFVPIRRKLDKPPLF